MKLQLNVSDIQVTQSQSHANKMLWTGVLTRVGVPSDGSPCGAGGKLLIIDSIAATQALPTIVNMPLNCEYGDDFWGSAPEEAMTGHNLRFVIGSITEGKIEENALVCSGVIWKQNFPDVAYLINNAVESLGFSIELNVNKYTEDDQYLTATDLVFTGACTLWKKCAAFESTEFRQLVASKFKQEKVEDNMNEEQMKALLETLLASFKVEIEGMKASVESKVDSVVSELEKANGEIATLAVSLAETKEELKASKEAPVVVAASVEPVVTPPAPAVLAAGQTVVANGDFEGEPKTKKQRIAEVWASDKSTQEKMKEVVRINAGIELK